jgi:hypothetical protein
MESNILQSLLSHSNDERKQAEAAITQARNTNPTGLLSTLTEGMKSQTNEIAQLASLMYKKLFLDDERADQLSIDDLEHMKMNVMGTLDFNANSLQSLKRKGDILSKIYSKQNKNEDLLKLLVDWASSDL